MYINETTIKQIKEKLTTQRLVAATKYVGETELRQLYVANVHSFGENRVQDFLNKYEALSDLDIDWHFIGTLQPNKVKYIIDKVNLIHSVDSLRLLVEINKQAAKLNKVINILLQVNISHEETKHGFDEEEISPLLNQVQTTYPNIHVIGLMTMAPYGDETITRPVFQQLKELQLKLQKEYPDVTELSMGMSNDYLIALEEGSTLIRVGSLLFK